MKNLLRIILIFLYIIVLVIPAFLVGNNLTFSSSEEIILSLHRVTGLYAFSLIFLQLILGSGRTLLGNLFNQVKILKFHMASGKIALLFIILHASLLLATILTDGNIDLMVSFATSGMAVYYFMGVFAFFAILVSISAAIFRTKIGPKWIFIHRLNYLIFWLVFFHSLNIGLDTHSDFAQIIYLIYGLIVALFSLSKIYLFLKPGLNNNHSANFKK